MNQFTLEPDEHMKWIYDSSHKDYNTEEAKYLRARRAAALREAPSWMIQLAQINDDIRSREKQK